jgi:DNA-binding FrmR family transcriptional regulator
MIPRDAPSPPGLHFDQETGGELERRLRLLESRVREVRHDVHTGASCTRVQAAVLRLRDEMGEVVGGVLKAHLDVCVAQCVQAGETSAALHSLKGMLAGLVGRL